MPRSKFGRHVRRALLLIALSVGALLSPAQAKETLMPEFVGISDWINSDKALRRNDLRGKVVLIDFWTYTCINCIRTLPYVKAWHEKYHAQGLEIVGVHSPEFAFEKDLANVQAAVKKYGLPYPVGLDNDHQTWNAYANRYWPAHYLFDREGRLRYHHFGEGNYDVTEQTIQGLLAEGGRKPEQALTPVSRDTEFAKIKTPEIYLGYLRLSSIGNPERIRPDSKQTFLEPKKLKRNKFYLTGDWHIAREFVRLESASGKILLRFEAGKANLVIRSAAGVEIDAEILIDDQPATAHNKGADVTLENGRALCRISSSRLYNLVAAGYGEHTLEIRFLRPGVEAYAFTFG